ncbi:hypothetical protein SAMN04487787_12827 [Kosakonia sacchari]|nr:hypothetical protein SAMN04487787_12827 [Kosakonia sacchari]
MNMGVTLNFFAGSFIKYLFNPGEMCFCIKVILDIFIGVHQKLSGFLCDFMHHIR